MGTVCLVGKAAWMQSIAEQDRYQETRIESERLMDEEGMSVDEAMAYMIADPKWQAPVDMSEEDAIVELDKLVKSETGCALDRSVAWVAENIGNLRATIKGAPSGTAWNLLVWVREAPTNKSEFIKSLLSRLMPSTKELDNQARYSDDGSKEVELAERILARMAENTL